MSKAKDSKYFNPSRKGEIHELQQELDTGNTEQKRDALKKIIAAMTIGKDVSMLFPDVVKQIRTNDLELKKLVYLYIMNYAKTQPDLAILSVNAFVTDCTRNPNPLIRALAIRTMGCIRVEKITEYLTQPLQQCLKDADPYVRKTAAVCVPKLYDISPELVESQGFVDMLAALLADSNPMVVSNAVAALAEISETSSQPFKINSMNLNKLLAALNECTEWGQIYILNSLAQYDPKDGREAEGIAERLTSRLQHNNSAVVLGAIRVLMKYLDVIQSPETVRQLSKKMAAPLVTLLSKEPELQYVALRNLILILQKRPNILSHELKVFFCKYNDPLYVKMEKLEIIIMLTSERNVDQVLIELKEYATGADVEFVRKAVHAIGDIAIKLERSAERCIHVLLELIESGYNPVVQESIVIIKDVFRKYPNRYESIIAKLCENLEIDQLEPHARASMVWILGHYAERIVNSPTLLHTFLESFLDEPAEVQLQLLTATVKLFLKRPKHTKDMVVQVLQLATECASPDVRDRGFLYWKLLTNPQAAKAVVLCDKPTITEGSSRLNDEVLDSLVAQLSTLAAVYHKPPETFVPKLRRGQAQAAAERLRQLKAQNKSGAYPSTPERRAAEEVGVDSPQHVSEAVMQQTAANLLDLDLGPPSAVAPSMSSGGGGADLLGGGLLSGQHDMLGGGGAHSSGDLFGSGGVAAAAPAASSLPELVPSDRGDGLVIRGDFVRLAEAQSGIGFKLEFANSSSGPLSSFAMQFNKNVFGISPAAPINVGQLAPGHSNGTTVPLVFSAAHRSPPEPQPSTSIKIAVKDSRDKIHFFEQSVRFELLFAAEGKMEGKAYLSQWGALQSSEVQTQVQLGRPDVDAIERRLNSEHIFTVARRQVATPEAKDVCYMSAKVAGAVDVLLEVAFLKSSGACTISVRTKATPFAALVSDAVKRLVQ